MKILSTVVSISKFSKATWMQAIVSVCVVMWIKSASRVINLHEKKTQTQPMTEHSIELKKCSTNCEIDLTCVSFEISKIWIFEANGIIWINSKKVRIKFFLINIQIYCIGWLDSQFQCQIRKIFSKFESVCQNNIQLVPSIEIHHTRYAKLYCRCRCRYEYASCIWATRRTNRCFPLTIAIERSEGK